MVIAKLKAIDGKYHAFKTYDALKDAIRDIVSYAKALKPMVLKGELLVDFSCRIDSGNTWLYVRINPYTGHISYRPHDLIMKHERIIVA